MSKVGGSVPSRSLVGLGGPIPISRIVELVRADAELQTKLDAARWRQFDSEVSMHEVRPKLGDRHRPTAAALTCGRSPLARAQENRVDRKGFIEILANMVGKPKLLLIIKAEAECQDFRMIAALCRELGMPEDQLAVVEKQLSAQSSEQRAAYYKRLQDHQKHAATAGTSGTGPAMAPPAAAVVAQPPAAGSGASAQGSSAAASSSSSSAGPSGMAGVKRPRHEGAARKRPAEAADDPYQRNEHKFREGAVCARPGETQQFASGQTEVLPLPLATPTIEAKGTSCCAGCRYELEEGAPFERCVRCDRRFHSEAESGTGLPSCFGPDATDASDRRFCILCLPPGPLLEERREQLSIVYDFEMWDFSVVKLERIINRGLSASFAKQKAQMEARRDGVARSQILYHLSSAGWGHVCEHGLTIERASVGLFGKALYSSPDPKKCDDYWLKATMGSGDAGAVVAASTGKDPTTTRVIYACRVLLGSTFEFPENMYDRTLTQPPDGYDSVSGCIKGQRELAVYANASVVPEVRAFSRVRTQGCRCVARR